MQNSSNMLQQETSMSPSYSNGLIIKVILLGREKSEGIWSSVHRFAYAAVMLISQLCFGVRQLLKEWEQKYGQCHCTVLFGSEKRLQDLYSSVKPSRLTSLLSSSLPSVHKQNLLSHTLCVATQAIQRQMLQGKQTAPSGSPLGASHLLCTGKAWAVGHYRKTELWASAPFPT